LDILAGNFQETLKKRLGFAQDYASSKTACFVLQIPGGKAPVIHAGNEPPFLMRRIGRQGNRN
jgi:hypothetical protein